ncbi:MAG: BatA domain-containing protein [Planctomycetota bacterium]
MNFLTPLYAVAALAIAVPILLHLVRKQPKNRLEFSSLLFLHESPPRLTRNSRIENWFLLFLRSLVLLMIAFAFARPYWSEAVSTAAGAAAGKRKCIVIDQSASMQREGVWQNAVQQAREAIRSSLPTDTIAIYGFDAGWHPVLPLSQANGLPVGKRASSALAAIDALSPSWSQSNLGAALAACLDALQVDSAENDEAAAGPAEIIVVSDLTTGCDVQMLEECQWPENVTVRLLRATPIKPGNASMVLLDPDASGDYRVRVSNARDSTAESFRIRWLDEEGKGLASTSVECTVPRGSHGIVKLSPPPKPTIGIELEGDDCPFDNRRFLLMDAPALSMVCVIEDEGLLPEQSLSYFLERVPLDTPNRKVAIRRGQPGSDWLTDQSQSPSWVILSHAATLRDADQALRLLQTGGHVTLVWDRPANTPLGDGGTLGDSIEKLTSRCAEVPIGTVSEGRVREFDFLQRLDFGHPIFAPLANSQFNDFSKVRFWRHRQLDRVDLSAWRVVAWFSENQPALMERTVGSGRVQVMTAGWQPVESQLALSSKFVPFIAGIFAQAESESRGPKEWLAGSEWAPKPGIYSRAKNHGNDTEALQRFAANLDPRESWTDPLDPSELSRFGVRLATDRTSERVASERHRVLVATELEARQAWWWWLVSACLIAVGLESLVCWSRAAAPGLGLAKE